MGKNIALHKINNQLEAMAYLASFIYYVVTHPQMPISLLTIALLGFNTFSLQDYFRSDQAKIEVAKPLGDNWDFSLMPEALAEMQKDSIIINGKLYGFSDSDVLAWKLSGKPAILVYQKSTGAIFTVQVDALNADKIKSFKGK